MLPYYLRGNDLGVELHRRRVAKWSIVGRDFVDSPKETLGFRIFLNPHDDSPVSTSIGVDGVLDLPLTCLMFKVLRRGMSFVDVGANLGYFSLVAAKIVGDGGKVFSFEPESKNFDLLSKSVAANRFSKIELHMLAVSDRSESLKLFKGGVNQPNAHSVVRDHGHGFEVVNSIALDEFWRKSGRPQWNLLKIHIGGDDPIALGGGEEVLEVTRPMLAMTFDPPAWVKEQDLLDRLLSIYEAYEIIESPFLLKKLGRSSFAETRTLSLFLRPRDQ